jgi:predicted small secreted protein
MTQRELISLTNEFGLYINPRTSKSSIVKIINSINANPVNFKGEWINLAKRYNEITLQDTRDKKLKKLGIV